MVTSLLLFSRMSFYCSSDLDCNNGGYCDPNQRTCSCFSGFGNSQNIYDCSLRPSFSCQVNSSATFSPAIQFSISNGTLSLQIQKRSWRNNVRKSCEFFLIETYPQDLPIRQTLRLYLEAQALATIHQQAALIYGRRRQQLGHVSICGNSIWTIQQFAEWITITHSRYVFVESSVRFLLIFISLGTPTSQLLEIMHRALDLLLLKKAPSCSSLREFNCDIS